MNEAWEALAGVERRRIADLFAAEPDRLERLTLDACGMHFDLSKTHLSAAHLAAFTEIAKRQDLAGRREALFAGAIVNLTEGRAAEHTAERGDGLDRSRGRGDSTQPRERIHCGLRR